MAVWGDDEVEFYSCPLKFIGEEHSRWYHYYKYAKDYHQCLPYHDQSPRFLEASYEYDRNYVKFYEEKNNQKRNKADGLRELQDGFKMRKKDG